MKTVYKLLYIILSLSFNRKCPYCQLKVFDLQIIQGLEDEQVEPLDPEEDFGGYYDNEIVDPVHYHGRFQGTSLRSDTDKNWFVFL